MSSRKGFISAQITNSVRDEHILKLKHVTNVNFISTFIHTNTQCKVCCLALYFYKY